MRSNTKRLGGLGLLFAFFASSAPIALGCGGVPETSSDVDYDELGGEPIQEVEQMQCSTVALPQPSDRWRLRVFNNTTFSGEPVDHHYEAIGNNGFAFNWGAGSPSSCVGGDNFSVVFSRNAYFSTSGTYTFTTTTDDGVKLFIDDVLIMSHWYDQTPTSHSVQHYVSAGWHSLRMKYYEHQGGAYAALSWNPYLSCPCNRTDNYCQHAPSTPGCPMTYPGGYCDPNGDASYNDGNWNLGYSEYQSYCK